MALKGVKVVLVVAQAVAHCVRILAQDHGPRLARQLRQHAQLRARSRQSGHQIAQPPQACHVYLLHLISSRKPSRHVWQCSMRMSWKRSRASRPVLTEQSAINDSQLSRRLEPRKSRRERSRLVYARVHGAHKVGGGRARSAALVVHRAARVAAAQVPRHRQVRCGHSSLLRGAHADAQHSSWTTNNHAQGTLVGHFRASAPPPPQTLTCEHTRPGCTRPVTCTYRRRLIPSMRHLDFAGFSAYRP